MDHVHTATHLPAPPACSLYGKPLPLYMIYFSLLRGNLDIKDSKPAAFCILLVHPAQKNYLSYGAVYEGIVACFVLKKYYCNVPERVY